MDDAVGGHGAEAPDQGLQVEPVQDLHHVIERAVAGDAEVVQLDAVRRVQGGGRLGLPLEAAHHALRELALLQTERLRPYELDGRGAGEQLVPGPPDLSHAPAAEGLHELVAPHLARLLHVGAQPANDQGGNQGQDGRRVVLEEAHRDDARGGRGHPEGEADVEGERPGGGRGQAGDHGLGGLRGHEHGEDDDPEAQPGDAVQGTVGGQRGQVVLEGDPERHRHLVDQPEVEEARGLQPPPARQPGDDHRHRDDRRPDHVVEQGMGAQLPAGGAQGVVQDQGERIDRGHHQAGQLQAMGGLPEKVARHPAGGQHGLSRLEVAAAARLQEPAAHFVDRTLPRHPRQSRGDLATNR